MRVDKFTDYCPNGLQIQGKSDIKKIISGVSANQDLIDASGKDIRLEIDGGVKIDNIREVASAGADTFVAGSAIMLRCFWMKSNIGCTCSNKVRNNSIYGFNH
jgi:ribulose-phosphate 3-epimerase